MGHRRIAFVANAYPDSDVDLCRLKGLRESLAARGIRVPEAWVVPSWNVGDHSEQIRALLSAPDRPTAFFCSAGFSAVRLIRMVSEFGLRVPEDLSVVALTTCPSPT